MGRRGAAQRRLGFWCGAADAMAGPSMSAADEGRFRLYRRDGTLALIDSMARQAVVHKNRSEEHTSELQSLMRISYAVFCLKKKKTENKHTDKYKHKPTYRLSNQRRS